MASAAIGENGTYSFTNNVSATGEYLFLNASNVPVNVTLSHSDAGVADVNIPSLEPGSGGSYVAGIAGTVTISGEVLHTPVRRTERYALFSQEGLPGDTTSRPRSAAAEMYFTVA